MIGYLKKLFAWVASYFTAKKDEPESPEIRVSRSESVAEIDIILAPPSPPRRNNLNAKSVSCKKNEERWNIAISEAVEQRKAREEAQAAEQAKQEALKKSPAAKKDALSKTRKALSLFSLFSCCMSAQPKDNVSYQAAHDNKRTYTASKGILA